MIARLTLGVDIGLDSVAIACMTGAGIVFVRTIPRSYLVKTEEGTVRVFDSGYHSALARLAEYARANGPYRVLVEQAYGSINLNTFKVLSHVEAELRYEFARRNVYVEFLAPTRWQHFYLGKGKREALEHRSMEEAKKIYPDVATVHEADAIHIARFGLLDEDMVCPRRKKKRSKSLKK